MDNHFGGVIWTNHALERLRERGIKQGDAWATFNRPGESRKGNSGNWVYYRTYGNERIEVVAKKNEKGEWLILSVWSDLMHQKNTSKTSKTSDIKVSFWRWLYNQVFKV